MTEPSLAQPMLVSCGEALVDLVPAAVPGGGPMNVAVAAARLGVPAAFIGRVSTDAYGQSIWNHLQKNGVDLAAAERGDEPTARAIVEHAPATSFRFEGEGTADTVLSDARLDAFDRPVGVVHGGTLGMFRGGTANTLAQLVERFEGLISLDPNVRPMLIDDRSRWDHFHQRWLARTHVYKASDEDLDWIWPSRGAAEVASELLALGVRALIVTEGSSGATVFTDGGDTRVPGRVVDVVDTVGAGDTFIATVLVGLVEREVLTAEGLDELTSADWSDLLGWAATAAAITCSRPGADPPTAAELRAWPGPAGQG